MAECKELTVKIIKPKNDPEQNVKELSKKFNSNRTFSVGYIKALEKQCYVKLKKNWGICFWAS